MKWSKKKGPETGKNADDRTTTGYHAKVHNRLQRDCDLRVKYRRSPITRDVASSWAGPGEHRASEVDDWTRSGGISSCGPTARVVAGSR